MEPPTLEAAYAEFAPDGALTTPGDPIAVGGAAPVPDAERVTRRHKLGRMGVVVIASGVSTAAIGVVSVAGGYAGPAALALVAAGGLATTVGEVMMLTGGIGSAKLLDAPTGLGWIGAGLSAGAFVVGGVSAQINFGFNYLSVLGLAMRCSGVALGATQLGQAGRAGRDAGLLAVHLVPSPTGLAVAGTF